MAEEESNLKVPLWLEQLPFFIRSNRGMEDRVEDGIVNLGLEIESENESDAHRYLHLTNNMESSIEECDGNRENNFVGKHTRKPRKHRRVNDHMTTLTEERIRVNQKAITMLEVNRCNPQSTEVLDITALNTRDRTAGDTEGSEYYFRGLQMNEFAEDDIRYISWKRVIMKSRGVISISIVLMITVIIIMAILIALVHHDHIPSHDSN